MKISMERRAFIKEHQNLIRILERGTTKQRMKEAREQKKELRKYA